MVKVINRLLLGINLTLQTIATEPWRVCLLSTLFIYGMKRGIL
jgi:hypothetical protein